MNTRMAISFKNETQKYTLIGVLFGMLFPAIATFIRLYVSGEQVGISSVISLHLSDPLIWIIDTAPIFLGLFALIAGRRQDNLLVLDKALQLRETELANSQIALENRISEGTKTLDHRTFILETIAEVVREISFIRNLDTLLNLSANLIRERFKYYHTGIYLVDERGEQAVLQAVSGSAAQQFLDQGSQLDLSDFNPMSVALHAGKHYQSVNVSQDEWLGANPLLPDAVSRIILPIRSKNITIGLLDIQTDKPTSINEQDIRTFQLFTDQLGTLIENSRLINQIEGTVNELNRTYQSQTRKLWQATIDQRPTGSYEFDGQRIRPVPQNLPATLLVQLENGKPVILSGGSGFNPERRSNSSSLLVPLMVFNELIGVIGLEQKDPLHSWTEEEMDIAVAAANRAALTLENARLLEESQRRAIKERAIFESTARIGSALNVENILNITAEEIERVLGDSEVIFQINPASPSTSGKKLVL